MLIRICSKVVVIDWLLLTKTTAQSAYDISLRYNFSLSRPRQTSYDVLVT